MKNVNKLLSILFGLVLVFSFIEPALAAQVKRFSISLSDSHPTISSNHTFAFTHTQSATLKSITFMYCGTPSGTCTKPTNLETSAAQEGAITGLTAANWTVNSGGTQPRYEEITGNGEGINANTIMSITLTGVGNHEIDDCQANYPVGNDDNSTDTCYVRMSTYSTADGSSGLIDEGIATYTVVAEVTVTARIDPTFTFVVSGVGANTVSNGITTSMASSFNELRFSNITAGTPKYAAHALNVVTNTENGYTVTAKMNEQMTGVYTANNVDPFAAPGVAWGTPQNWLEPTGTTPNDNTSWIGANTSDTNINGWSSAIAKFGPINSSENVVMLEPRSDNGTVATTVVYAIEANVFQPADTYTGKLIYNALPTY